MGPATTDPVAAGSAAFVSEIAEKMTATPTMMLRPARFFESVRIDSNPLSPRAARSNCRFLLTGHLSGVYYSFGGALKGFVAHRSDRPILNFGEFSYEW
jgi:hypothetical protein